MDQGPLDITPEHVLHSAAARLLDVQVETYHALDARNANIISVSSTVLPLAFWAVSHSGSGNPKYSGKGPRWRCHLLCVGAHLCVAQQSYSRTRIPPPLTHASFPYLAVFGFSAPALGCQRIRQRDHGKRGSFATQGATHRMGEYTAVP